MGEYARVYLDSNVADTEPRGHVAIFSFAAEMRNPADFTYSLGLVQVVATVC